MKEDPLDLIANARKIMAYTRKIQELTAKVEPLSQRKAEAEIAFIRAKANKIEELRQGGRPLSGIEKVAEGNVSELDEMIRSKAAYQATNIVIDNAKTIMNGLQSVNRHLDSQ